VEQLHAASDALIAQVERIPAADWPHVSTPGEWSPGKDAEHVADGNALHQWVVRSALRQRAGKRPAVERQRMTAAVSQLEVARLLKERVDESARLIESLTDEQLDLPCRTSTVGEFVERALIGHITTHHTEIARKLERRTD